MQYYLSEEVDHSALLKTQTQFSCVEPQWQAIAAKEVHTIAHNLDQANHTC
jgi:hypothetical protein